MDNKELNKIEDNTAKIEDNTVNIEDKSDNTEGAQLYKDGVDFVDKLGLEFTFRSIDWVLKNKHTSFSQLRSCVYINNGQAYFDYVESTLTLIECGLIGGKIVDKNNIEVLEDKAYDILESFKNEIGFIGLLHIILINKLEDLHFFITKTDVNVLEHLSYKNLQRELAVNLLREDLEEKTRQAQALSV